MEEEARNIFLGMEESKTRCLHRRRKGSPLIGEAFISALQRQDMQIQTMTLSALADGPNKRIADVADNSGSGDIPSYYPVRNIRVISAAFIVRIVVYPPSSVLSYVVFSPSADCRSRFQAETTNR